MARRRKIKIPKKYRAKVAVAIVIAVLVAIIAFFAYGYIVLKLNPKQMLDKFFAGGSGGGGSSYNADSSVFDEQTVRTVTDGDFSVHFLELGNKYTGDSIYVKAGNTDILIDAGSRANSIPVIKSYLDTYVTDGSLEFVVATHGDQDHIAGFAGTKENPSIFTHYDCETIIDFPLTNKSNGANTVYGKYLAARDAEVEAGATHYTALECWNQTSGAKRTYTIGENITMSILYHEFYEEESNDENNYSVCLLFTANGKNYLLTGDLEAEGEASLVANNSLPEVELFKAGHHGSYTSSTDALLSIIKPKIVCVCCCAGNDEYTTNNDIQFPSQNLIDRVSPYTDALYVTTLGAIDFLSEENKEQEYQSLNGTIIILANANAEVKLFFSNSPLKLKDTDWFKSKRTMPSAWQ